MEFFHSQSVWTVRLSWKGYVGVEPLLVTQPLKRSLDYISSSKTW
ncbi:MAG: hypothetical protein PHF68_00320 [Candidatus ainarchaeum sp.]|nr:hypothetical protein [Candidatus ainarchaeum sp.]